MYRCLIWGTGKIFYRNINFLKVLEELKKIKIIALTGNNVWQSKIADYDFVCKEKIQVDDYDLVIVMSDKKKHEIENEAVALGFKKSCILCYQFLNIPNVDVRKYIELKDDIPSIFCMNCWGGITYHQLGLEFMSPFVNMFVKEADFLRFLHAPRYYIEQPLVLDRMEHNFELGIDYPVCRSSNVELYFNHYPNLQEAIGRWNERLRRINWDNIFVTMYTENELVAEAFDNLPYDKKICFVPFETNIPSAHFLPFAKSKSLSGVPLHSIVSGMAWGIYPYYDAIELLMNGKIKPV